MEKETTAGVTINDVAAMANVSVTTVSLVLNGKRVRASQKTRKAIFDAAEELGYKVKSERMIKKEEKVIGLILPDISNPFFSKFTQGVIRAAQREGYTVMLEDAHTNEITISECLKRVAARGADGIIMSPVMHEDANIKKTLRDIMGDYKIPVVIIDRQDVEYSCNMIMTDNYKGGYMATEHLISLGHTRIGCIDNGTLRKRLTTSRITGYLECMSDYGLNCEEDWIVSGQNDVESGYQAMDKLLDKNLTAVFACNDMMAVGAYKRVKEAGLKIPDDISIIGFDDVPVTAMLDVPITTIHQHITTMGIRAVDIIVQSLHGNNKEKTVLVIEPELIVRKSTGRVKEPE